MTAGALLLLCFVSMNLLIGFLVLVVARGERNSPTVRFWGWGLLVYGAGMLIIVAGTWLPLDLTQIVGNALICLAAVFTALAIFVHTPLRLPRNALTVSFLLATGILVLNHVVHAGLIVDIATPTLYASLLYAVVSYLLIRYPPPAAKAASRFLVVTVVLTLVVWNVRLVFMWISLGATWKGMRADFTQAAFAVTQMLLIVSSTLGILWVQTRLMEDDLRRSAFTDILTGLPNRRAMLVRFREEAARALRQKQKFGVALFDIDNFKQINDTCGHYVGDAVLKHIGDALSSAKRGEDSLGRIGGEEFLVILPHHESEQSIAAAERLRLAVVGTQSHQDVEVPAATVSGGVAIYPDDGEDWDRLFMAADRRLYRAKRGGRNRVEGRDE